MQIHGLNKTTLLDYPGHLAATIFLGGCNFRCPFCHNKTLVLDPMSQPIISEKEVLSFLEKRKDILEGLCITGGEPTLEKNLLIFIRKVKALGLKVKLDTNGYRPEVLRSLLEENLLDYVAMDIKGTKEKYPLITGVSNLDINKIEESIHLIMTYLSDYEFRTTIMKEFHSKEDIKEIKEWISGCKKYRLNNYRETEDVISPGFTPFSESELHSLEALL